ncbi:MAG: hypothetical protein F6K22_19935 [Okeania sp. SIO2F4]|uniref:hypothetical protein n=1 Tax=Okeania sp. SIO2F4 TaxID=2607790 RepID=UPI00142C91AF|nr:hypothetical protein [Okeania sp. SIO2F4]NES04906.1 hypothetical protein [Okeania sp. SIO2F4]
MPLLWSTVQENRCNWEQGGVIPFLKKNAISNWVGKCGECGECGEVGTLHATSVQHKNTKH